jgi:outer membrane protein assembly factor BamB
MPGNKKASYASSSLACDGERLFINFLHDGAAYTTAMDLAGKQLWQQNICAYKVHQGYGSSPAIYKHLVIVSADNKLGGAIMAMERASGKIVWKRDRPEMPNYPSPIILNIGGKDQLIMTGCELVTSLNPLTGEENWEIKGATTECVTTTPTDGKHVYSSGGYPKNHVAAIAADGSGEVVWENNTRVYVPSLLIKEGYLYGVADNGVAMCWDSATGKEMWKGRLGGNFTASPVLFDEKIMATNETGKTYIFHADPKEFTLVGTNELGDQVYASPVIVGNKIFFRAAYFSGSNRSEKLVCVGK